LYSEVILAGWCEAVEAPRLSLGVFAVLADKTTFLMWLLLLFVREFQNLGDEPTEIIGGDLRKIDLKERESRRGSDLI